MGARSPPEGYRVAAARYGLPVRKRVRRAARVCVIAPVVPAAALLLAACGVTGSKSAGGGSHASACAYVAKLDEIAAGVAQADVHDPVAFNKTLDAAVHDYVSNVKSLRAVAPSSLSASLDRVESDVQQYRFDAARTDRAELDAYAARNCGRTRAGGTGTTATTGGTGTTDSLPATTSTLPSSSTTVSG